jgi:hypothetical protein
MLSGARRMLHLDRIHIIPTVFLVSLLYHRNLRFRNLTTHMANEHSIDGIVFGFGILYMARRRYCIGTSIVTSRLEVFITTYTQGAMITS